MLKEEIEVFKNELKNLNFYYSKLKKLNEQEKIIIYNMTGVKGVSFDKIPATFNEKSAMEKFLSYSEKLKKIQDQKKEMKFKILTIKQTLEFIDDEDDKKILFDVVVEKTKYQKYAEENGFATKTKLYNKINSIIAEAIKKRDA